MIEWALAPSEPCAALAAVVVYPAVLEIHRSLALEKQALARATFRARILSSYHCGIAIIFKARTYPMPPLLAIGAHNF